MCVDLAGYRLFVSAEDNNTIEVIDLVRCALLNSIPGVDQPKWSFLLPSLNKLYVANGGDGSVRVFDARSFKETARLGFDECANNLRYDDSTGLLYVGTGQSFGGLGIVDTVHDSVSGRISLAAYPKQFELERLSERVYVNEPTKNQIEVVDRSARRVVEIWPIVEGNTNVPMALDEPRHRLFVGCRSGVLMVLDTGNGRSVSSLPIGAEVDGIWFDARRRMIYVTCGAGEIDVIREIDPDHYSVASVVATRPGAATSLWVPALNQLFVAVPQREDQTAAIRIYDAAK